MKQTTSFDMMSRFGNWLVAEKHLLVTVAVNHLAQSEMVRSFVTTSVIEFIDGLAVAALEANFSSLEAVIKRWIASRSTPTPELPTSGSLTLITTFKQIVWQRIRESVDPEQAIELLFSGEQLFNEATHLLVQAEAQYIVYHMQAQLQTALQQVEHVDRSKANFVSVAAHELRTPLTVIDGYVSILRSELADPAFGLILDGIQNGLERLREMMADMLDVSRIDLGMLELHYQPIVLSEIIEAIQRESQSALRERRQVFQVDQTLDSLNAGEPLYADLQRLRQAIQKVVNNAIKYTPDGGTIIISSRVLPQFIDIIIMDTGIGIAPDELPYIFEAFSTLGDPELHSSGKAKFKGGGPGLGLCIAKGILEAHGGTIWAESPGYDEVACPGSTFHIMIPVLTEQ